EYIVPTLSEITRHWDETKGHMSAVERLAASKLKYVKSLQVVNSTQEPVISIGSGSVSTTCGSLNSSPVQVRRSSSKNRPDSLLIYRQKCELLRGSANSRKHLKITTPEGTAKECSSHTDVRRRNGEGEQQCSGNSDSWTKVTGGNKSAVLLAVPEVERRPGKGVSRSHSDISSRYSKNFADFDAFFKYCGLDGEVIESLGKKNFSCHSDEISITIRSASVSTDDGTFSRHSGGSDGLQKDELQEKIHQGTSVIERNARIIKWLYSCKNASETGKKLRDLD
uniref:Family with sequence similarity 110 member C n=1 Tax=Labrus bergylta TaxID=56723 RepID=A0A3Q3N109_9LABR